MPELRFTLLVESEGVALPDFPLIRRVVVNEATLNSIAQAADNNTTSFHAIPSLSMPALGVFMLTSDQAVNLKFNLNTPVPFNADCLVLMVGIDLTQATPSQNIEVNVPGASATANLEVLGGGT
jgi:hypothetical protein